jgi:hypothetical protein
VILSRRSHLQLLLAAFPGLAPLRSVAAGTNFNGYTDREKEAFLESATIDSVQGIDHGVTKPLRVELSLGGIKHSASLQVINKDLPDFFGESGPPIPMKDSWRFNVAAYRVDRLLDLRMTTVAVARPYQGKPAALSWWVDDVMFEEVERVKQNITAPDLEDFNRQMCSLRVFDELIINIDRNLSNILITKEWKIALIDHSRCFTPYRGIRNKANLTRCSRKLMSGMKGLTLTAIKRAVGPHLTAAEMTALLARRDRIVEYFAAAVAAGGEENVLFS